MVLQPVVCLVVVFLSIASALPPRDPWESDYMLHRLTASNYRGPYFPLRHAFELVDLLSTNLTESALYYVPVSAVPLAEAEYHEAPFSGQTWDNYVGVQLDNAEGGKHPAPLYYISIETLIHMLRSFIWSWEDEGWVPTFDIRLRDPGLRYDWRGNVTQLL